MKKLRSKCLSPFNKKVFRYVCSLQFLILLTFAVTTSVAAAETRSEMQQLTVRGTVIDETGLPLPGVNIKVEGTSIGINTDSNGKYTIIIPNGNAVLLFSFIGYNQQRVPVEGRTTIDIRMVPDLKILDEVVIVGYGSVKKSDITGSVSSIKTDELNKLPVQRVDQALQGKAAGVMVLNTDGAPGGNTTIRIRGMNSITGGNNALIVIDGQMGGNINTLDPNDIESMEVLKDASATAIYGSKGANGVILISTKTGKKGKPLLSYSINYGFQKLRNKLDLLNAGDFAKNINANRMLDNLYGTPEPIFTQAQVDNFVMNGGTDWQGVIYQVAPIQNHSLSISGGTDNTSYFFSGGYLNQTGILKNSGYNRLNIRANITTEISKWLNAGLNVGVIKSAGSSAPFGSNPVADNNVLPILQAPLWEPTIPVYDADGNYSKHPIEYGNPMSWNPLASVLETKTNNAGMDNTINAFFEFKILPGLTLKVIGAGDIVNSENRMFFNEKTFNGRLNNGSEGEGIISSGKYEQYQNTNILTFDKTYTSHHFTFTAVAEQQLEKSSNNSITARGFTVIETGLDDIGSANTVILSSGADKRVLNSFLGRINYSFADKYLLTLTYRADGSSVFGINNKWGYFPSVALGWKLSEESFIKDLNFISNLKIRGSWGIVGNQGISPYQTLAALSSGYNYPYNGTDKTDLGFRISRAANPNLKWESTSQIDLGVDFGLFEGRLTGSFDVYKKETTDLLMFRNLPYYTGLGAILDNIGSTQNKGIEFSVSGDPVTGKFNWNTVFNFSINRNKVVSLGDNKEMPFISGTGGYSVANLMYLRPGEPFGQMYGYGTNGMWKESERAEAKLYGQLPGMQHFTDVNNDTIIDINDRMLIGNAMPKFIFGWSNRFSFKGFDLTLNTQGVYGNDIFNMQRINLESSNGTSKKILDKWTVNNQGSEIPAAIDAQTLDAAHLTSRINLPSLDLYAIKRFVEDASYLRLKNVTLAYNFPTEIISKLSLMRVRVFITGTNLITLTKYSGYDPEISSFNDNDAQIGIDLGNYPTAKIYTFGIDVSF